MKKEYDSPTIAVIMFDNEDIITSSGILGNEIGSNAADDLYFSEIFGL